MADLDYSGLLEVYRESILKSGALDYPYCSDWEQQRFAEEDLYYYLQSVFFTDPEAVYALWCPEGRYAAALRVEPYNDGMLVSGLETAPDTRNRGWATALLKAVLDRQDVVKGRPVYAHIAKDNYASLKVHQKCGFKIISDYANYIDGTVSYTACTVMFK